MEHVIKKMLIEEERGVEENGRTKHRKVLQGGTMYSKVDNYIPKDCLFWYRKVDNDTRLFILVPQVWQIKHVLRITCHFFH